MACGYVDGGIGVWPLETWGLERTLCGHEGCVSALVVSGGLLISSSRHGTLRVWSLETWGCVQKVEAYPAWWDEWIASLAVCGSAQVGVSEDGESISGSEEREVRVWDLATLRPLHTLLQPAGGDVVSLASVGREVWGAVGPQGVVWGRRGVPGGGGA